MCIRDSPTHQDEDLTKVPVFADAERKTPNFLFRPFSAVVSWELFNDYAKLGQAERQFDDDSDDEDAPVGNETDLQVPSTKAIAFKWLGKVRRTEVKTAWEDETEIVEDVQPKQRMERKKPKAKKKK